MEHSSDRPHEMRELKAFPWKTTEEAIAYREQLNTWIDPVKPEDHRAAREFDDQLLWLPETDVELAKDVFTALATSELDELRNAVALRMDTLFVADKETAAPLWQSLLEDPEPMIHENALEALEGAVEAGYILAEDVAHLVSAYGAARERYGQTTPN